MNERAQDLEEQRKLKEAAQEMLRARARKMATDPEMTTREIARQLGKREQTVALWLRESGTR